MSEKIYLQQSSVTVTSSKVQFGGKTYFLRNISSVSVVKVTRQGVGLLFLLGFLLFVAALTDLKQNMGLLVFGLAMCGIAFAMGFTRHYIHFDTSSGSVNAYYGKKEDMCSIKEKIEEALAAGPVHA